MMGAELWCWNKAGTRWAFLAETRRVKITNSTTTRDLVLKPVDSTYLVHLQTDQEKVSRQLSTLLDRKCSLARYGWRRTR